jgi:hypothetical protein
VGRKRRMRRMRIVVGVVEMSLSKGVSTSDFITLRNRMRTLGLSFLFAFTLLALAGVISALLLFVDMGRGEVRG